MFTILGFDILLMKNLKPMLLEVNANPSMRIEHEQELSPGVFENVPSLVDEEVKVAVIRDTLRLIDPLKNKKKENRSSGLSTTTSKTESQGKESWFQAERHLLLNIEAGQLRSEQCNKISGMREESREGTDEPQPEDIFDAEAYMNNEASLPSICLKQVFPKYAKQFNYLRLVDRMANLFIRFLGIKGTTRLGPTGFRTFIRNCKLSSSTFSMASVDILYIDITRRWNSMGLEQKESGMCLQAFVEAFFFLAQRRFKHSSLQEQVASLVDLCEYHLTLLDEKRLLCSKGTSSGRPPNSSSSQERLPLTQPPNGSFLPRNNTANKFAHYRHPQS
ncbi:tubulin polyglutamylase TTLL11 isoform X4 [Phascolarctos cinereus]